MNLNFISKNITLAILGLSACMAMAQTQDTTTTYGYDAQGNRTSITDPLGRTTTFGYDALNRRNRTTDPYNGSTKTGFDALDQIRQITDPRDLTTQYGVNNLGDQLNLRSPDTGNRSAKYDTGGNMIQQIDARGVTEKRKYDALNRVTRVDWVDATKRATPVVSSRYIYDQGANGIGRMTGIIDESGHTEFSYDLRGRMLGKVQTVVTGTVQKSFSMSQTFGKAGSGSATGHMTSLTYPSGNRLAFTYDAVGRVQSVTLESNNQSTTLMSDISYNHFTDVNGWTWGNGSKWYRQYDLNGRVTHYPLGDTIAGGLARTVVYDAASRIRSMTHTGDASGPQSPALFDQRFEYDDLNRLTQFTVNNFSQTYLYDANGNRTQVQQGSAGYVNDIDPVSNRLQRAAGPGGTRNFTYDAEGNIKTDGTLSFEFALHGRMRSVSGTAGKTTYWYNALGQRVRKTGQDTTYYFYDGEGRVLGEYDRNGSAIQETVYLDNMPVVVLKQEQGNTVPYYVYSDHINTPRVITRASDNAMVWRWDDADPFGAAAPDASLAGGGAFSYNPRFPGQMFDVESGLHQNYFRDYDPKTGRYVTSDPIGLQGGVNTYGYVEGNPVTDVDPLGLQRNRATISPQISYTAPISAAQVSNLLRDIRQYDSNFSYQTFRPSSGPNSAYTRADVNALSRILRDMQRSAACSRDGVPVGRFISDQRGNTMIEPIGGSTGPFPPNRPNSHDTHTFFPNGSNHMRLNPRGHGPNPQPHGHGHLLGTGTGREGQGSSTDIFGNVVPSNSPAAHWPIN